jgi:hypothetical protein
VAAISGVGIAAQHGTVAGAEPVGSGVPTAP